MHLLMYAKRPLPVFGLLIGIAILHVIFLMTPLGFPYRGNEDSPAPQRLKINHISRTFYNISGKINATDAGFLVSGEDRNGISTIKKYVLTDAKHPEEDCEKDILCSLLPERLQASNYFWIPAEQPDISESVAVIFNNVERIGPNRDKYNFTIAGPDRISVEISVDNASKIVEVGLPNQYYYGNWSKFYINYLWGAKSYNLNFDLMLETNENGTGTQNERVHVIVRGKHVHDKKNEKTKEFQQFLSAFPDWAHLDASLASRGYWIF